ncbi:hypothetical protein [Bacillus thuringiensis]|uniref:hypothetical protein n=1 Tax=Bacillus thuringiensis TaxID=1428 RepID=UPI000BFC4FED|nr:hypothetical protein [Bacillus thuringiensis]PGT90081.1 hypothetical protein COD17_10045 [Bacillus thuringiensis]
MSTLKTYRVLVNETTGFDGEEPKGLHHRHVQAENEIQVKEKVEKDYGTCMEIQEKPLTNKDMKFVDLEEGKEYEILAGSEFIHDTLLIKKEGEWVHTTIRGGFFKEEGFNHSYKVKDVLPKVENFEGTDLNEMTLAELEALDCEIFFLATALVKTPETFIGLVKSL